MILALDIETSGLEPDKSFITCIGLASEDGIVQFAGRFPNQEALMLEDFAEWLEQNIDDSITALTYNGRHFDIPFLLYRATKAGVELKLPTKHVDMMAYATSANGGARIPKDMFLSKYLNMYVPRSCSGAWLARQYTTGKMTVDGHFQNMQHNATDLTMTLRAYEELLKFEDFEQFCNEQAAIDKK